MMLHYKLSRSSFVERCQHRQQPKRVSLACSSVSCENDSLDDVGLLSRRGDGNDVPCKHHHDNTTVNMLSSSLSDHPVTPIQELDDERIQPHRPLPVCQHQPSSSSSFAATPTTFTPTTTTFNGLQDISNSPTKKDNITTSVHSNTTTTSTDDHQKISSSRAKTSPPPPPPPRRVSSGSYGEAIESFNKSCRSSSIFLDDYCSDANDSSDDEKKVDAEETKKFVLTPRGSSFPDVVVDDEENNDTVDDDITTTTTTPTVTTTTTTTFSSYEDLESDSTSFRSEPQDVLVDDDERVAVCALVQMMRSDDDQNLLALKKKKRKKDSSITSSSTKNESDDPKKETTSSSSSSISSNDTTTNNTTKRIYRKRNAAFWEGRSKNKKANKKSYYDSPSNSNKMIGPYCCDVEQQEDDDSVGGSSSSLLCDPSIIGVDGRGASPSSAGMISKKAYSIKETAAVTVVGGQLISFDKDDGEEDASAGDDGGLVGMRLSTDDDPDQLNSLHCFVRAELLEVCTVIQNDNDSNDKTAEGGTNTHLPRIGLRCIHCGQHDQPGASMSAFFPKSLGDIYRGVCTWQRIHFKNCSHIPEEMQAMYCNLKDIDRTRGRKAHWIKSAYQIGLRDVDENRSGIVWKGNGDGEEEVAFI